MKNNPTLVLLLSILSILVIGTSLTISINAQEENATEHVPEFFAIQHANSGIISEINSTFYKLELNDVSDKIILFSDRPDRIVMSTSTSNYIGNWTTGEDSFAVNPPNAVLIVDEREGQQDTIIVELFNPIYDSDKKALNYEAIPNNVTSIDLPYKFGQLIVIIDTSGQPGGIT
ncbi:MAG: hypothetical protein ACPKPY_06765 [Nitrososphaeraceae archaeon]